MHGYVREPVDNIDGLSYISAEVYFHIRGNIFSSIAEHGGHIFVHFSPRALIYYLGEVDLDHACITLDDRAYAYYKFFTTERAQAMLQEILNN